MSDRVQLETYVKKLKVDGRISRDEEQRLLLAIGAGKIKTPPELLKALDAIEKARTRSRSTLENNASGESGASLEAQRRTKEWQFVILDRTGKVVKVLHDVESVDFAVGQGALASLPPGHAYAIRHKRTGRITVLERSRR